MVEHDMKQAARERLEEYVDLYKIEALERGMIE